MEYRDGQCKQCGECCKHIGWFVSNEPGTVEFLQTRGCQVTDVGAGVLKIVAPLVCSHLVKKDGIYMCNIHKNKPYSCRIHPSSSIFSFTGCGYFFNNEEHQKNEWDEQ